MQTNPGRGVENAVSENALKGNFLNHTDQHRQIIRTMVCAVSLLIVFVYLSSPRLLMKSSHGWIPSDLGNGQLSKDNSAADPVAIPQSRSLRKGDEWAPDASLNRSADALEVRSHEWSVIGFPFDAVHIQKSEAPDRSSPSALTSPDSLSQFLVDGTATFLNLLAGLLVVGGGTAFAFEYHATQHRRVRTIRIVWAGCLLFVSGSGMHFWQSHRALQDFAQLGQLVKLRSVQQGVFNFMPASLVAPWTHVYSFVQSSRTGREPNRTIPGRTRVTDGLSEPSLVACIARHPHLHTLELHGDLPASMQQALRRASFLHTFRWHDVPTVPALRDVANSLIGLSELRVSFAKSPERSEQAKRVRPNTIGQDPLDFRDMTRLEQLWISGINQSELASDAFSIPHLQQLALEFAGYNQTPFVVERLSQLRQLRIAASRSTRSNFAIEVRQMPELRSLMVPVFRPVDLKLVDVPRLKTINTTFGARREEEMRTADYAPWFHSLQINDAPSLAELSLTVVSTKLWMIDGCPNLRTLEITEPSESRREILRATNSVDADEGLAPVWKWLEGPLPLNEIIIERLDLREVDLLTWKSMKFLKRIQLKRCLTNPGQMQPLAGIESLVQIDASDIKIDTPTAERLLESRTTWEMLLFDWSEVEKIQIVDQPKLITAIGNRSLKATQIHLENLPRLQQNLHFSGQLDELIIKNAPLIGALVFKNPIPETSWISGVEGLRDFCVRDSIINRNHCDELGRATYLQTLLLPSCQVTPALTSSLSKWKHLMMLDLSGATIAIDSSATRSIRDEDLRSLGALDSLLILNLDNSDLGSETIRQISSCNQLQAVSVANCGLTHDHFEPLIRSTTLAELRVDSSIDLPAELREASDGWGDGELSVAITEIWNGRSFLREEIRQSRRDRPRSMTQSANPNRTFAAQSPALSDGSAANIVPQ